MITVKKKVDWWGLAILALVFVVMLIFPWIVFYAVIYFVGE